MFYSASTNDGTAAQMEKRGKPSALSKCSSRTGNGETGTVEWGLMRINGELGNRTVLPSAARA